ncbi:hypothetical protein [Erythrobacter sp. HL-111]|uniref:hypothetical protein n=1 Tax=Erythrobacter sp. HL-111 TaxID=1798193 RepID=UPI0006DB49B3|nr:hypothetical protein [Erythrobacter sp. HL-111]KPP84853.1 MAG: hypothetical protein HLUCCO15_13755 [Erythrobacteraceae bacterium HL-111]
MNEQIVVYIIAFLTLGGVLGLSGYSLLRAAKKQRALLGMIDPERSENPLLFWASVGTNAFVFVIGLFMTFVIVVALA